MIKKMNLSQVVAALILAMGFAQQSIAANTPCSGKKGGIAHCDGARFVCNDGSYSASKKVCSAGLDEGGSGARSKARSGRSTGGQVKPANTLPSPFN